MEQGTTQERGAIAQATEGRGVESRHIGDIEREPHRERIVGPQAVRALAVGATALGALALGAFAIGTLAVGRVAIGRLVLGGSRVRKLTGDDLEVKRLRVGELKISERM